VLRLMSWSVAWLAALQVSAAQAQGNIDAGKTPAQIFSDTCSACHRSARDLRRASASFLRAHYTAGADEANAMANYLAGLGGGDPRAATPPAQPKRPPADIARQPPRQPAEPPKSAQQQQPKGRPSASAQVRAVVEERPPEPPPPAPVLEPFEE